MGQVINWIIGGFHKDKTIWTQEEYGNLVHLLGLDLSADIDLIADVYLDFTTVSLSAKGNVERVLRGITGRDPNVIFEVEYQQDCDQYPTKFGVVNGMITTYKTEISYIPESRIVPCAEYCPHCDSEATVPFDLNCGHLSAICPECGARLMLCSYCPCRDGYSVCDWNEGSYCKYSNIECAEFISVRDDESTEVITPCKVDKTTGIVFDIGISKIQGVDILDREYVLMGDTEFDLCVDDDGTYRII